MQFNALIQQAGALQPRKRACSSEKTVGDIRLLPCSQDNTVRKGFLGQVEREASATKSWPSGTLLSFTFLFFLNVCDLYFQPANSYLQHTSLVPDQKLNLVPLHWSLSHLDLGSPSQILLLVFYGAKWKSRIPKLRAEILPLLFNLLLKAGVLMISERVTWPQRCSPRLRQCSAV